MMSFMRSRSPRERVKIISLTNTDIFKQDEVIQERWVILYRMNHGKSYEIYKAYDSKLKREVALKVSDICRIFIRTELHILQKLKKFKHFCKCFHYNSNYKLHFIVLELQGPNLSELKKWYGMFPLTTLLRVGLQMLEAIQYIHEAGFVHCNIRPSKFVIGKTNSRMIYLIDFSRAKEWNSIDERISETTDSIFEKPGQYSSINVHIGRQLSRRDDLWSLLYSLIGCTAVLPWNKDTDEGLIFKKKKQKIDHLINSYLTTHFLEFRNHISSLGISDLPNYEILKKCFIEALNQYKITDDSKFHWENYQGEVWKLFRTRGTQHSEFVVGNPDLFELSEEQMYEFHRLSKCDDATKENFCEGGDSLVEISDTKSNSKLFFKIPYETLNKRIKDYVVGCDSLSSMSLKSGKSISIIDNDFDLKQLLSTTCDSQKVERSVSQVLIYPVQSNFGKADDLLSLRRVEANPTSRVKAKEIQTSLTAQDTAINKSKDFRKCKQNKKESIVSISNNEEIPEKRTRVSRLDNFRGKLVSLSTSLSNFSSTKLNAVSSKIKLNNNQNNDAGNGKNDMKQKETKDVVKRLSSSSSTNLRERKTQSNNSSKDSVDKEKKSNIQGPTASNFSALPSSFTASKRYKNSNQRNSSPKEIADTHKTKTQAKRDFDSKRKSPLRSSSESPTRSPSKSFVHSSLKSYTRSPVRSHVDSPSRNSAHEAKSKHFRVVQNTTSSAGKGNSNSSGTRSSKSNNLSGIGPPQKNVSIKKSKKKIEDRSTESKPLRILSPSCTMLLLPDKKKHPVPPKPEIKPVYRPCFSLSLVTVPESECLSLEPLQHHQHLLSNLGQDTCPTFSTHAQQYNPIQAIFLDPYNQFLYIQGNDTDQFRQLIPALSLHRNLSGLSLQYSNSRLDNQVNVSIQQEKTAKKRSSSKNIQKKSSKKKRRK